MLQRNPEVRPSAQGLVNNRLPPVYEIIDNWILIRFFLWFFSW